MTLLYGDQEVLPRLRSCGRDRVGMVGKNQKIFIAFLYEINAIASEIQTNDADLTPAN
jgi:hypothetical protein